MLKSNVIRSRLALIGQSAAGALLALAAVTSSAASTYPDKPIRVIVPFPAGGGTDIAARLIMPAFSKELKQSVIVENRAGAATVIGTDVVANAPADGYTLLYTSSAFTANASLMRKLSYDPLTSFYPIGCAALHPFVLVANPSVPANNLKELISYAKQNPGKLNYASAGPGSTQHLEMELLKRLAGLDIVHVPYRGSSPAMTDLLGGQVNIMFNGVSPTLAYIRSGKLKVFATDSNRRLELLPNVPTMAQAGVSGFNFTTWSGLLAPSKLPPEAKAVLDAAWKKAMAKPEVQKALAQRGLVPNYLSPTDFAQMLRKDKTQWAELVRDAHVQPQ